MHSRRRLTPVADSPARSAPAFPDYVSARTHDSCLATHTLPVLPRQTVVAFRDSRKMPKSENLVANCNQCAKMKIPTDLRIQGSESEEEKQHAK